MKKTYVKPVITFIELPKNNFIATSSEPQMREDDWEGNPDDGGNFWFD